MCLWTHHFHRSSARLHSLHECVPPILRNGHLTTNDQENHGLLAYLLQSTGELEGPLLISAS